MDGWLYSRSALCSHLARHSVRRRSISSGGRGRSDSRSDIRRSVAHISQRLSGPLLVERSLAAALSAEEYEQKAQKRADKRRRRKAAQQQRAADTKKQKKDDAKTAMAPVRSDLVAAPADETPGGGEVIANDGSFLAPA